jgi:hypothetical protein
VIKAFKEGETWILNQYALFKPSANHPTILKKCYPGLQNKKPNLPLYDINIFTFGDI